MSDETLKWWYLSFARPTGFAGAILAQGADVLDALQRMKEARCEPPENAEVMGMHWPEEMLPPAEYRHQLLTKSDIDELFGGGMSIAEDEATGEYDMEALNREATFVCGDCLAGRCREHGK